MDLGLGLGNLTLPLKPLNGRIKFRLRFTRLQSTSCDPGHLRALTFPNNHHCLHQRSQRLDEGPKASEPQKASSKARESSPAPQCACTRELDLGSEFNESRVYCMFNVLFCSQRENAKTQILYF